MRTLYQAISRFRRDRSGNIAIIFALAALPIVTAVGCAVDYSRANQIRSKLISAADAECATAASAFQKHPTRKPTHEAHCLRDCGYSLNCVAP